MNYIKANCKLCGQSFPDCWFTFTTGGKQVTKIRTLCDKCDVPIELGSCANGYVIRRSRYARESVKNN